MRTETLSAGKGGISRLRYKGGASKEVLYDLSNAYRTASQTIVPRPGSRRLHNIPGTIGLCVFEGKMVVFASTPVLSPSPDVVVEVLTHPVAGSTANLHTIHFAKPFLGYLYVVASWDDDPTVAYHYYLQSFGAWVADTPYRLGAVIQAQTPNGYGYVCERLTSKAQRWAPNVTRAVNDKVEPAVENDYEYVCIAVYGTTPNSGTVEPTWPTIEGAVVIEETDGTTTVTVQPPTDPPPPTLPPTLVNRYNNMGGGYIDRRRPIQDP